MYAVNQYAYNSVLSISPSSSLTIKIYCTISLHIEQYYSQVYFPTSWTWSCAVHEYHSPSSLEFILPLSRASAKEVAKTRNKTKRKDTAIVGGVTDDLVLLVGSVAIVCCDYLLVKAEKRRKRQPHVTALLIAKCLPLHFHWPINSHNRLIILRINAANEHAPLTSCRKPFITSMLVLWVVTSSTSSRVM